MRDYIRPALMWSFLLWCEWHLPLNLCNERLHLSLFSLEAWPPPSPIGPVSYCRCGPAHSRRSCSLAESTCHSSSPQESSLSSWSRLRLGRELPFLTLSSSEAFPLSFPFLLLIDSVLKKPTHNHNFNTEEEHQDKTQLPELKNLMSNPKDEILRW